jgi:hypothetical protein
LWSSLLRSSFHPIFISVFIYFLSLLYGFYSSFAFPYPSAFTNNYCS